MMTDKSKLLSEWGEMKSRTYKLQVAINDLMERKKSLMATFVDANSPLKKGDIVRVGVSGKTIKAEVIDVKPDFTLYNEVEWEIKLITTEPSNKAFDSANHPFIKRLRLIDTGYQWQGGLVKKLEIMGA